MLPPSLIEEYEQRMVMSGFSTGTITLVESLSLPAEFRTVSRTVFVPDELKLVEYDELLPLDDPPLHK